MNNIIFDPSWSSDDIGELFEAPFHFWRPTGKTPRLKKSTFLLAAVFQCHRHHITPLRLMWSTPLHAKLVQCTYPWDCLQPNRYKKLPRTVSSNNFVVM